MRAGAPDQDGRSAERRHWSVLDGADARISRSRHQRRRHASYGIIGPANLPAPVVQTLPDSLVHQHLALFSPRSCPTKTSADQHIGHRSPEDGVAERDEGQHSGKGGQDHGPRALPAWMLAAKTGFSQGQKVGLRARAVFGRPSSVAASEITTHIGFETATCSSATARRQATA